MKTVMRHECKLMLGWWEGAHINNPHQSLEQIMNCVHLKSNYPHYCQELMHVNDAWNSRTLFEASVTTGSQGVMTQKRHKMEKELCRSFVLYIWWAGRQSSPTSLRPNGVIKIKERGSVVYHILSFYWTTFYILKFCTTWGEGDCCKRKKTIKGLIHFYTKWKNVIIADVGKLLLFLLRNLS